jgi:curved DNA-binding protein CbpA
MERAEPKETELYDRLGVKYTASAEEIRAAWRERALKYHPDKNPGDTYNAKETFNRIKEAYDILSDEGKRNNYDKIGSFLFRGTSERPSTPPPEAEEDNEEEETNNDESTKEEEKGDRVAHIQIEIQETEDWLKQRMQGEPLTRINLEKLAEQNPITPQTMLNLQSKVFPLWRQVQQQPCEFLYVASSCAQCSKPLFGDITRYFNELSFKEKYPSQHKHYPLYRICIECLALINF